MVLQSFLQEVINGGRRTAREYALGRRRKDLLIEWLRGGRWDPGKVSKYGIECKAVRAGRGVDMAIDKGPRRTVWYVDRSGGKSGHLAIFDQRPAKSWEERVFRREEIIGETTVTV